MLPKVLDPFEEMNEMLNHFSSINQNGFVPAMDIYETKDDVVIETLLTGVNPKDVEVNVKNSVLTIRGKSNKEHEVEDKNYYRKEMRSGSFFRQVALPTAVKEDNVKAEFEDGVLKVICPKIKVNKPKKIDIKVIKSKKK